MEKRTLIDNVSQRSQLFLASVWLDCSWTTKFLVLKVPKILQNYKQIYCNIYWEKKNFYFLQKYISERLLSNFDPFATSALGSAC